MTKMVSLRVIVPADDDAAIGDVQKRLREHLEDLGTDLLTGRRDGPVSSARVHWMAADVLQGSAERPPSPAARRGRKPRVTPDQGSIASVSHDSALEELRKSRPARRVSRRRKRKLAGKAARQDIHMSAGTRSSSWSRGPEAPPGPRLLPGGSSATSHPSDASAIPTEAASGPSQHAPRAVPVRRGCGQIRRGRGGGVNAGPPSGPDAYRSDCFRWHPRPAVVTTRIGRAAIAAIASVRFSEAGPDTCWRCGLKLEA